MWRKSSPAPKKSMSFSHESGSSAGGRALYGMLYFVIRRLISILPAIFAIAVLYLVFSLLGINCPIKFMTGISCPGCGMTRAVLSAATFHFKRAFAFHPLWVLMPVWAGVLLFRERLPRTIFNGFTVITVLLFLITYVLRMLDTNDMIVVFEPDNGFWMRLFRFGMDFIKEV